MNSYKANHPRAVPNFIFCQDGHKNFWVTPKQTICGMCNADLIKEVKPRKQKGI